MVVSFKPYNNVRDLVFGRNTRADKLKGTGLSSALGQACFEIDY